MARVTVLHLVPLAAGGMRQHVSYLLRFMDRSRYRPLLAWPAANGNGGGYVPVFRLEMGERLYPWQGPPLAGRLAYILRREGVELLHAHGSRAWFLGLLARTASLPMVCTVHGSLGAPRWIWRLMGMPMAGRTAGLIAVSQAAAREVQDLAPGAPVQVIYNGIDLARFPAALDSGARTGSARNGAGPVLGTVARLQAAKGVDVLLQAAGLLRHRFPGLRVLVAGEGPQRGWLERQAGRMGLGGCMSFLGERNDIPALLREMDVFALPSRSEGLPLGLLEAMAAGRPVVASAVGGVPELIRHGHNGLLVPAEKPAELAAAVQGLLEDTGQAGALARQARADVEERFTAERMAMETEKIYERVLGMGRPGSGRGGIACGR